MSAVDLHHFAVADEGCCDHGNFGYLTLPSAEETKGLADAVDV